MTKLEEFYQNIITIKSEGDAEKMFQYIESNSSTLIEIFSNLIKHVNREGKDEFFNWLGTTDFTEAPASTKYHLSCKHGLLAHSLLVYYCLGSKKNASVWKNVLQDVSGETLLIIALLHDICKTNFYVTDWKNKKVYSDMGSKQDEKGRYDWKTVSTYSCEDANPLGHGEKSVINILKHGLKLTDEEIYAIRWHMGWSRKEDELSLSNAFKTTPLVLAIVEADMEATYLLELQP